MPVKRFVGHVLKVASTGQRLTYRRTRWHDCISDLAWSSFSGELLPNQPDVVENREWFESLRAANSETFTKGARKFKDVWMDKYLAI